MDKEIYKCFRGKANNVATQTVLDERREFWKSVYIAYVGAANATDRFGGARWADIALDAFDVRIAKESL